MAAKFKIHPAIGLARLGNSPTSFYLAPETTGGLPLDCDATGIPIVKDGKEQPVAKFKDDQGRIKRQAARFRVFVYDDDAPAGRELKIGARVHIVKGKTGQLIEAEITDINWTVYLANKKSSWYEFRQLSGEHGYAPNHPLRNAAITNTQERQQLIIDPGPRTVCFSQPKQQTAQFSVGSNPGVETFPPPLRPNSITTLGGLICTQHDQHNRLLVLGGFGNSGSMDQGFGNPKIEHYANNDGWFDDTSDGPVTATLSYNLVSIDGNPPPSPQSGTQPVDVSAWVMVGYPRYAPQIVDVVTMDDLIYDVSVRQFAYEPLIYGLKPFDGKQPLSTTPDDLAAWRSRAQFNSNYYPYFWRDIWPILKRPLDYQWVMDFDPLTGGDPHQNAPGSHGNFDPDAISIPPFEGENPADRLQRRERRMFIYRMLRKPGWENSLAPAADPDHPDLHPYAMPLLCGDNPISNELVAKFFRLTDTMLFLLRQWAEGKFINERREQISLPPTHHGPGVELDRGVLGNALGGSFCPGAEAGWIMRNPAIYSDAYRIAQNPKVTPGSLSLAGLPGASPDDAADLGAGQEPGDLTKYSAVPWQSDFNECTTQSIDITYEQWNVIYPDSTGDPVRPITYHTYWWPAHRPVTVNNAQWSPTPVSNAGDLQMVTQWGSLGFVRDNPDFKPDNFKPQYIVVESET
jgi:L-Lysine epsilon oxidase N-terminal/L-lysine epsilon oxidase C-terminal domain